MDAVAALRESALFTGFTDTGLNIIAGICTAKSYPIGTPLFVEKMVADSLLVIADGKVSLNSAGDKGEEIFLGELGPGDFLGELSLISTSQRMCTARAATQVKAFEIRQGDFHKLMGLKPQACMKLLMAIVTQFGQKVAENREALKSLLVR